MEYVRVAIDTPVDSTFDYHVPPELEGKLQPGHLVEVAFGTARQHAIVLEVASQSSVTKTKPVLNRLDPVPALTPTQIALSLWLRETTLAPIGTALWIWLPPGLTGHHDLTITLLDEDYLTPDDLEMEVLAVLKRRRVTRSTHLNQALPAKTWRPVIDALAKAGVIAKESTLTPPRVKPRVVQTAALAVHPHEIERSVREIAKESRPADLLAVIAEAGGAIAQKAALKLAGAAKTHLDKLIEAGDVTVTGDTIQLNLLPEQVDARLHALRKLDKPQRILGVLARHPEPLDVSWLYAQADCTLSDLKKLEEAGLIALGEREAWRDSLAEREFIAVTPPALTIEQAAVWERVRAAIVEQAQQLIPFGEARTFLLHGVTGSGKTEIYLRAIEETRRLGRSAILLVPEIALTPQTIRRVAARFPGQVAVVHSGLSEGERYDTWRRAREGQIGVIVGARSALFSPLPDVGLIILDEEHDSSYKQSPPILPPYYHARDLAEEMMRRNGGVVILGSATPDINTTYRAGRGEIERLELPHRIMGHRVRIGEQAERTGILARYQPADAEDALMIDLPPVQVVDMRDELKRGNTSIFSRPLQYALADVIDKREQAILFLNRRGQSTYVFCRDCGYVAKCPQCDTPLTYHRFGEALRCHRCGFEQSPPTECPACGSKRIKFFGAGTQQVEQTLIDMFPKARTVRWDSDTAQSPEAHEAIMQRFIDRKADIMIGTQLVAKGLDLPLVTLVGVVSADIGLALPDFRAGERTFQVLTQVAGRAGRGLLGGRVVLQTYQPEHYAIQAAAKHDYARFYQQEIAHLREIGYPPFRRLARILFRFPTETKARSEAIRAAQMIRQRIADLNLTGTEIIGPAPCFFPKEANVFRWHLLVRSPDPAAALRDLDVPRGWYVDIDPVEVL
jgi:primosomal protein N' (replication factor Y)